MGRKPIKEIRHGELIDAAIKAIHQHGYAAVTIIQIAREADTAAGSIHYYFGSKEGLLGATMRRLLNILRDATLERLADATGPRERLVAMAQSNFDNKFFSIEQCSVWTQFWANAPYEDALARLHKINRARVRSNFRAELKLLLPPEEREVARRALQAYMDGVWLQAAQASKQLDPPEERRQVKKVIDRLLMD